MIVGLGVDIIKVSRIGDVIERHGSRRFVERIFTPAQGDRLLRKPSQSLRKALCFARFAAYRKRP